jgi:HEAT repeat protein
MLHALLLLSLLAPDDKEVEEALDRFKTDYKNSSAASRSSAVTELSKTQHDKTLAKIAGVLSSDEMPVRISAAKALGNFSDYKKKASLVLLGALGATSKETADLAIAILEALGKLGEESALPTIHERFEDKDAKIAKAALLAAGDIKKSTSIDVIIELMKKYEKITGQDKNDKNGKGKNNGGGVISLPGGNNNDPQRKLAEEVLPATIKALTAITKEKWTTSKEWILWWSRHKSDAGK